MKAVFLGWTKFDRRAVVYNGTDWIDSPTENTHAQIGKAFEFGAAKAMLNDLRVRFGGLDEIQVLPLATVNDVRRLAKARRRK